MKVEKGKTVNKNWKIQLERDRKRKFEKRNEREIDKYETWGK